MYMCDYVCGGQRLMPGIFLNLFPLYIWGRVSHLNPDLTDLSSLPRQYLPGIPCLRLLCAESVDGPPCLIGGNWGPKVQCLFSHYSWSHLPSPPWTCKHWSHSLDGYVSAELLGLIIVSSGQWCLPRNYLHWPLAHCFSHFWLIGIAGPLSISSFLDVRSSQFFLSMCLAYILIFLITELKSYSWLINISKTKFLFKYNHMFLYPVLLIKFNKL